VLRQRLIFGISLAVVLIGLILLDGYLATREPPRWRLPGTGLDLGAPLCNGALCTLVVALFTWLAAGELLAMARARGHEPFELVARLFAVGLVVGPLIAHSVKTQTGWCDWSWEALWLALALTASFVVQGLRHKTTNAGANIAATMFAVLYAGVLAGFLVKLRVEIGGAEGVAVLALSVFAVKMNDTGAYFIGRALGRHKLIEWLSPNKTWEGFAGGLVVAVLATLLAGADLHAEGLIPMPAAPLACLGVLAVFGLLMALASVLGDLCASLLKRDVKWKDSGKGLPGLGGVLDVFDSPLFAAPFAWFYWTRLVPAGALQLPL
jgi:phosphatidate cytidylyltransferase